MTPIERKRVIDIMDGPPGPDKDRIWELAATMSSRERTLEWRLLQEAMRLPGLVETNGGACGRGWGFAYEIRIDDKVWARVRRDGLGFVVDRYDDGKIVNVEHVRVTV